MRDSPGRSTWETEFADFFVARQRLYVRIAYTILGGWPAAEDATQDAFSVLYAKWRTIRGSTPDPFARRVLVNTCLNHVRKQKRERRGDVPADVVPDLADGGVLRVDLRRALLDLDPQSRAVVALRYLHDLSVREVADALGMAEGTVKSRSSRAIERLRGELGDEWSGASPTPAPPREQPTPRTAVLATPFTSDHIGLTADLTTGSY